MPQVTVEQAMQIGLQHHHAGRLRQAEEIYRQVLARQPGNAGALHHLGVIAHQVGRNDVAVDLIRRAVAVNPNWPDAYNNLAVALFDQRLFDGAIDACRRAIALDPAKAEAYSNLGSALRERGQLDDAIAACRRAVALRPDYAEARGNLAAALQAKGRVEEAIAEYRRAVDLAPSVPETHYNLGNALSYRGQLTEAIGAYQQAIALKPDFAEAYSNLANALKETGQFDDGIAACRRAIELRPGLAEAHLNLGNMLNAKGELDEAIAAYGRAVALRPDYAEAYCNLGGVLREKGRLDDALAACNKAIALRPDLPEAFCNLGNALTLKGQLDEALTAYDRAISLRPGYAEARGNLANVLKDMGRLDGAIAAYRQAIALRPDFVEARTNLGNALTDDGQLDEAIEAYRQAIALRPNLVEAHSNLGSALQQTGRLDDAIAAFRRALALSPDFARAHSNLVLALHYHGDYGARAIAEELGRWNRRHAEPLKQFIPPHSNDRAPDRRLRIGYVSPDFREHVVGWNLLPLFVHHDRSRFEITCYAQVSYPDDMTARFRQAADAWCNIVGLTDEQVADQVRRDRIDILVDLALHTGRGRLLVFARKPAPVQVTWLAYCGSSGISAMDYRLSDPCMDPWDTAHDGPVDADHGESGMDESAYTEQTIRLPHGFWCYAPPPAPDVSPSPAMESGVVTFGCLNNFAKVSPAALDLWARIMSALPDSRMIIHAPPGQHLAEVAARFGRAGVDADRIRFVGRQPREQYIQRYCDIDIALDPFPFGGGITTCDALWMGVPVVSLSGNTPVGRGGRSILSNLGLPELVAFTHDQYARIAIELARDPERLQGLRRGMRARMLASPLMDARGFAGDVEAAFRLMWRKWCERVN